MALKTATRGTSHDTDFTDWAEPPKEARDWKKLVLVTGLAVLSWVATYVGMLELIEANMGELPLVHKVIIGFSVAMLMTMIVWLLDKLFQPIGAFTKVCYAAGYVFLSIISIGFGFGFYWKVLESKGEGTRVAETAVGTVQAPLQTAATRLEGLGRTLDSLQTISAQKAEIERTQGTSCPNSRPGDGPRRKLREDDAARFAFARDVIKTRIESVRSDIGVIDGELAKITKNDASIVDKAGTRNDFMKGLNRRLDQTVTNFNAFRSDPQLKQIRNELDERAGKSQFLDTQGKTYACPDPGLATMIRSVVASIDALPLLERPKIATVEGSDATIEAFRRLTATFFGALAFKLPPSAEELRELQKKAVAQADTPPEKRATVSVSGSEQAGLSKRDYIPLAIAVFVDLCLLLVSMARPSNRLGNLVPRMQAAERGPVIQILSRFNEIHRDKAIRENFEIFRHVVFDLNGDYYIAVPLDAPPRMNPKDREDLRLEAQLLSNLFTSFEKDKIFSRVLMPYITTRQIQKKLWKQGSKFSHAESFRLYKFKDGAWSEIILGAIMGAAKRVEAEKRRRRIEDDVFTRHEPSFTGLVAGHPQDTSYAGSAAPAPVAPTPYPMPHPQRSAAPPPPPYVPRPPRAAPASGAAAASAVSGAAPTVVAMPRAAPLATTEPTQAAFGPYAAAAAAEVARPAADRMSPTMADVVADLTAHRQRVGADTAVDVRPANNNTGPATAARESEGMRETGAATPTTAALTPIESQDHVTVEAVERKVTFQVPTREAVMPASLQALIEASQASAAAPKVAAVPALDVTHGEDDAGALASRFAPEPRG